MTNFRCSLYAALCLIAGCVPPPGAYQPEPQPGWEQGPTTASSEDEEYGSSGGIGSSGGGDSTGWLCTAEASLGTTDDGSWSYSNEKAQGGGDARDDAYTRALENCNSVLNLSVSIATSQEKQLDIGTCEVTDCIGPGEL